jgi:hypothetical protein
MADEPRHRRDEKAPAPQAARYPLGVEGPERRRRWDYADGIARELFGDLGEAAVFMAAVVLFESEALTD